MKVVLERGKLGDKVFPEENILRAKQRVKSLSYLHGDCPATYRHNVYIVHASSWYGELP